MKRTLLEIWFLLHCCRGKDDKKKDHFWILTCNLSWTSIFLFNFYPSLWYHKREIQKQQDKRESRSRLSLRLHSFNSTLFCIGTKQTRIRSQGSELLGGCISLTQEVCDFFFFWVTLVLYHGQKIGLDSRSEPTDRSFPILIENGI